MNGDRGIPDRTRDLLEHALRTYRATVFWNMSPSMTAAGVQSAARALKTRGDLDATRLADALLESLDTSD